MPRHRIAEIVGIALVLLWAAPRVHAQDVPLGEPAPVVAPTEPGAAEVECASRALHAPAEPPSRRQVRRAQKLVKRAGTLCKRGSYAECAQALASAYGLDGADAHLHALAAAYEGMDDLEAAVCTYRQLLSGASGAEPANAEEIAAKLASAQARRAEQERQRATTAAEYQRATGLDCTTWALQAPAEPPSRKDLRRAGRQARAAGSRCKKRDFADCAAGLQAAYRLDGRAEHMHGLGQAYEGAKELSGAICSYRGYLDSEPASRRADEVKARVAALYAALVDEQEAREAMEQEIADAASAIDCTSRTLQGPTRNPSSRQKNKARTLFRDAEERCLQGQFAQCIETLTSVYAIDGDSAHIFSLGRVAEQMLGGTDPLQSYEDAICYYRQFLATPERADELAQQAEERLAALSLRYNDTRRRQKQLTLLAKENTEKAEQLSKTKETLQQEAKEREQAEAQAKNLAGELDEVKIERDMVKKWVKVSGRSTSGSYRRHIGAALIGLGSLGLGVGTLYGLEARRTSDALSQNRPWSGHFDELVAEGESANRRAIGFSAAGAAAVIAGGVLYYLGERASRNVEVELEVDSSGAPAGATLSIGASF